jgi:hypothetical protein
MAAFTGKLLAETTPVDQSDRIKVIRIGGCRCVVIERKPSQNMPKHRLTSLCLILLPWAAGCVQIEPFIWPRRVVERDGAALRLSDGRVLSLPGVREVKDSTPFLDASIKRGVEVKGDRLIGQMRIWHWCGNDPVWYHLARVDLADLAVYVGEGIPVEPLEVPERYSEPALSRWGWSISDYYTFKRWRESLPRATAGAD